jgi:hypothetical protein
MDDVVVGLLPLWKVSARTLGGPVKRFFGVLVAFCLVPIFTLSTAFAIAGPAAGPTITGLLVNGVPSDRGHVGAKLTIEGNGFGATMGFSTATLNGIAVAGAGYTPILWSDKKIVTVIPVTVSSGPVIVTVDDIDSNHVNFYVDVVLLSVWPKSALAGKSVTVAGNGLGTSGGTVTFNGQEAQWTGWGDSGFVAIVPPAATAGPIVATVSGQESNGIPFTPIPWISRLSPPSGPPGTIVTIAGYSFGHQQGDSKVTFSGVTAEVSSWSNKSIRVSAPGGAVTGDVAVTVNGVHSRGKLFTYTLALAY